MKAHAIEFRKSWDKPGDVKAKVYLDRRGKVGATIVNFEFDFDCIPYAMHDLQKLWMTERSARLAKINSIDRATGAPV